MKHENLCQLSKSASAMMTILMLLAAGRRREFKLSKCNRRRAEDQKMKRASAA